jgi:NAD(P)H dehydrogenase (quinone)
MRVIVTGASGHLGRLVAEHLLERIAPADLILVTRRPEALREWRARGADVRFGDFNQRHSLSAAFAGGERMLLISTDTVGHRVRQHRAALDAAAAAGVRHVVFTSIVNPVAANPLGANAWEQGLTEAMLERGRMDWTALRFGNFAELCLAHGATAVKNGQLVTNGGRGRMAPISRRDCAAAAAVVLAGEGHSHRTYDIVGPQRLSSHDLAAVYCGVSGKEVKVVALTDVVLQSVLVSIGTPVSTSLAITGFGRAVRQGYFDVADPAFERLTGRAAASLGDVLRGRRADLLAVA